MLPSSVLGRTVNLHPGQMLDSAPLCLSRGALCGTWVSADTAAKQSVLLNQGLHLYVTLQLPRRLWKDYVVVGPWPRLLLLQARHPTPGVPLVAFTLKPEKLEHGYTEFDVSDRLRQSGWVVPVRTAPFVLQTSSLPVF